MKNWAQKDWLLTPEPKNSLWEMVKMIAGGLAAFATVALISTIMVMFA